MPPELFGEFLLMLRVMTEETTRRGVLANLLHNTKGMYEKLQI
jgi:hypothetical protein